MWPRAVAPPCGTEAKKGEATEARACAAAGRAASVHEAAAELIAALELQQAPPLGPCPSVQTKSSGWAALSAGDAEAAAAAFTRALSTQQPNQRDAGALLGRAEARLQLVEWAGCEADAAEALERSGPSWPARRLLAQLRVARGDDGAAAEVLREELRRCCSATGAEAAGAEAADVSAEAVRLLADLLRAPAPSDTAALAPPVWAPPPALPFGTDTARFGPTLPQLATLGEARCSNGARPQSTCVTHAHQLLWCS